MKSNSDRATRKACRTCLVELDGNSRNSTFCQLELIGLTAISGMLLAVAPEIDLHLMPDAVICINCSTTISLAYEFKKKCLEIECAFHSFYQSKGHLPNIVDIIDVLEHNSRVIDVDLNLEAEAIVKKEADSSSDDMENYHTQLELVDIALVEFNTSSLISAEDSDDGIEGSACNDVGNFDVSSGNQTQKQQENDESRKYLCYNCNFSTQLKTNLISHMKIHRNKNRTQNGTCRYQHDSTAAITSPKDSPKQHKSNNRLVNSSKVQRKYARKEKASFDLNIENQPGKKLYQCDTCDFRTAYKNYLGVHVKLHKPNKPYKCPKCEFSYVRRQGLNFHMASHSVKKPFKCDICNYKAHYKHTITSHMKIHLGNKSIQCMVCDYKCMTKHNLQIHMNTHTGKKPYKCGFCNYCTTQPGHLKIHERRHTGEKPYKCTVCKYSTISKTGLDRHINSHAKDKPYKCKECDYATTQPNHLKLHMRRHTGEKPYQCNICDYKAVCKDYLDNHVKIHTGEKPLKCTECSFRCIQKSALRGHMKRHQK